MTLAFVLIAASALGSIAHPSPCNYHGGIGATASSVVSPGDSARIDHNHDHGTKKVAEGGGHANCTDLFCHGGFVILIEPEHGDRIAVRAVLPFPVDETGDPASQSSLYRPPINSTLA